MEELLRQMKLAQMSGGSVFPTSTMPPNRPTDTDEELSKRKKPCNCGYDPFVCSNYMDRKQDKCSVKLALRNHLTFPSFEMMSEYDDPSMLYYEMGGMGFQPARHWATLIEITHDLTFARPGCCGLNQFGERISVHFYHDNDEKPVSFKWSQLKPGNTLAIMYPEKKQFLDGTEGIREESLDSCYIFNSSLKNVQDEAQRLMHAADVEANVNVKESPECFGCGLKKEKLMQCSACKHASYCSKECQVKAWKDGHKYLCKQSEMLLRLAVLPRYRYEGDFFSFNEHTVHSQYIPPYKQIGANKRRQKRNQ
jgi:hypothetical protein